MTLNEKFSFFSIDEATSQKVDKAVSVLVIAVTVIISIIVMKSIFSNDTKKDEVRPSNSPETVSDVADASKHEEEMTEKEEASIVTTETDENEQLAVGDYEVSTGKQYIGSIADVSVNKGIHAIEFWGFQGQYYVPKTDFENVNKGDTRVLANHEYYCIDITEEGYWFSFDPEATLDNWFDLWAEDLLLVKNIEENGKYPVYYKTFLNNDEWDRLFAYQAMIVDDNITINCAQDCIVTYKKEKKSISEMDKNQMINMVACFEFDENGNIISIDLYEPAG